MFRQEALEKRKMKWRGRAILTPGISPWLIFAFCLFFLSTFLTFIILGDYTRRVTVTGEITTSPRAVNIYSSVQGVIAKQFVYSGQHVKKGDPIYLIDVSKSTRSGVASNNQRKDIQSQLSRIDDIIAHLESSKYTIIETLEKQKIQYSDALKLSTHIVKQAQEGIQLMKDNMNNYKHYQKQGLINKDQLFNQISLYYQQQNNLLSLSSQNEQNALQITSLESQIQTQAADFNNRIYEMELQKYELQKELVTTDINTEIVVRAMSEGKIDSLSVTVGQMVNIGDSLMQVLPSEITNHYLIVWVPNDAAPYVDIGDKVNVRYEAFPAEKFGQFSATVTTISKTPASSQEMDTYPGAPKNGLSNTVPYYKVIVRPDRQTVIYDNKSMPLENGMKAQITLFLEKRKIYQWMLSPLYDMKYSAIGPIHE